MFFIGIITNVKNEAYMSKILRNIFEEEQIIFITDKNIENMRNIRFETIIMNRNIEEGFKKDFKEILKSVKYFIANSDIVHMEQIQNMNLTVITYGFGSKCTVTTSSIEEEEMIICLQRGMNDVENRRIEPQEFKIKVTPETGKPYLRMAIETVKILYGKS